MSIITRPETQQQADKFAAEVAKFGSIRAFAVHYDLNYSTVQDWACRSRAKFGIELPERKIAIERSYKAETPREAKFKTEAKEAKKNAKELTEQLKEREEEIKKQQTELSVYEALEKAGTYRINSYKPHNSEAVVVAVASDWHCGEAVDPRDLPGELNVYNPQIFEKRAEQFFQRSVYLTDAMARGVAKVDTMVLALLGDLMTGYLHDDQRESNHLNPMEEVLLLEEVISGGLEYLLSKGNFNKIIIPCCHGNHGRTTDKMRAKTSADTSYEVLLYKHLAKRWAKEKRLDWKIATGHHMMLKLWDYTIRFHHGDAVNYGGGVGGLTIPLRKAIAGWDSVQRADLSVCGHFHSFTDGGDFIVNGSLIGYNAYALRVKARYEPPQQAFFMVDPTRGKTMTARIFTDYLPK